MCTEVAEVSSKRNVVNRYSVSGFEDIFGNGDTESIGRKIMLLLAGDLTAVAACTIVVID